jgi:hypothetical protein
MRRLLESPHGTLDRQIQLDWTSEAAERRDDGVARAHAHAESDAPGWTERALALLVRYAEIHAPETFLVEDAREYAYACGLTRPSDGRCWGGVTQAARRRKLIVQEGVKPARTSNLSLKPAWRKAP